MLRWLQSSTGGSMSDLYVLTVWKNGWAYASPVEEATEVPEGIIAYTRTLTRAEALREVLDAPINEVSHGRQSKQGQRPQFRA